MKPTVIIIGADKGGVGKTTLARVLLDFLVRKNVIARAFDTENPRGTLSRFYPRACQVIDMGNVADQMKLLDTLESDSIRVSVVDLKAGNLSSALDLFDRIGVLEAARNGQFNLALVHVIGPAIASLNEMGEIAPYTKGIDYVVARNFINETNFFEWDNKTYKKYFANLPEAREIEVPKLNEMAYEQVDLAGVTFSDFVANKTARGEDGKFSFTLRGYVRKWLADLDTELEGLNMIQALSSAAKAHELANETATQEKEEAA